MWSTTEFWCVFSCLFNRDCCISKACQLRPSPSKTSSRSVSCRAEEGIHLWPLLAFTKLLSRTSWSQQNEQATVMSYAASPLSPDRSSEKLPYSSLSHALSYRRYQVSSRCCTWSGHDHKNLSWVCTIDRWWARYPRRSWHRERSTHLPRFRDNFSVIFEASIAITNQTLYWSPMTVSIGIRITEIW